MSVFDAQYAEQYDLLYAGKSYTAECDLIEAAVRKYATTRPRTLLDVGCGTGGHALELARRGYSLTGVDLSDHMLGLARGKSAVLPEAQQPKWLQGDARNFEAGGPFDMAIMMFAVIGYLTGNDDVLQGLRNIRRHLPVGALFLCDFWYGPSVLSDRPTDRVRVLPTARGEVIRATSTALDVVTHTANVTFKLWSIEDGRVVSNTRESHLLRYFFPQEFALLLSQAGFAMQSISAFPTLDAPLTDESWNAFVVARTI
ncbi:MAG TPA: methyltransferase domain-containing protein [Steroidobacteraceae bacterium]|jgi:SAM-dependent methyltransferase|nr:methyltransferase domain-containing protein [Steroidobacteraceae bacterium]